VALLAGTDGLSQIRKLVNKSRTLLKKNGKLIFEIGKSQLNEVIRILKKNKFYINEICNDLQSYPRVIVSTKLF
jgi:release factor glutamine methyltransferase